MTIDFFYYVNMVHSQEKALIFYSWGLHLKMDISSSWLFKIAKYIHFKLLKHAYFFPLKANF